MDCIQTKIKFPARKKLLSVKKISDEKENGHANKLLESPIKSPSKLTNNDRDQRFLLKVNSPNKRSCNSCDKNSVSSGMSMYG